MDYIDHQGMKTKQSNATLKNKHRSEKIQRRLQQNHNENQTSTIENVTKENIK